MAEEKNCKHSLEVLQCVFCNQGTGLKDPKFLPCFHTACVTCLDKKHVESETEDVKCPKCQSPIAVDYLDMRNLPHQFVHEVVSNSLDKNHNLQVTKGNLEDQSVKFWCSSCENVLDFACCCSNEDHVVVSLEDFKTGIERAIYRKLGRCKDNESFIGNNMESISFMQQYLSEEKQQTVELVKDCTTHLLDTIKIMGQESVEKVTDFYDKQMKDLETIARTQKSHITKTKNICELGKILVDKATAFQFGKYRANIEDMLGENTPGAKTHILLETHTMEPRTAHHVPEIIEKVAHMFSDFKTDKTNVKVLCDFSVSLNISGIAVSDKNDIIVVGGDKVMVFDTNRKLKSSWESVADIASVTARNGYIYVAHMGSVGAGRQEVCIFDTQGDLVKAITFKLMQEFRERALDPVYNVSRRGLGLAVDEENNVYISSLNTNTIYKCKENEDTASKFVTEPFYCRPRHICITPDQELLVINLPQYEGQCEVVRFNKRGARERVKYTQAVQPMGLCCSQWGTVFVTDQEEGNIHVISAQCLPISKIPLSEVGITKPNAIAVTKDGNIVVSHSKGQISVLRCAFDLV